MKHIRLNRVLIAVLAALVGSAAHAQYAKMDGRLSDLVDSLAAKSAKVAPKSTASRDADPLRADLDAFTDEQGRILIDIYLDGSTSVDQFVTSLIALGANVTGVNEAFNNGAISAFVPASAITTLAATNGLHVMKMTSRPQRNAGKVTSQGAVVIRADLANASGYDGTGITVGVMSDSFDKSPTTFTTIRAANDIASGDLVAPKLLIDAAASTSNTDEGRAMAQIVHDVAPGAALCFATANGGDAAFAANIRTLRTDSRCNADVIVDDVFYFDEPFVSDGQIAQAVNDVSTSTTLAGKPVAYFSSAGNQGSAGGGGSIDVPKAVFSTAPTNLGNIDLSTTATCTSSPSTGSTKADVAGGWLDFGGGTYAITLNYASTGSQMLVQWDDPFFAKKVSTDMNLYLFTDDGKCVFAFATNNLTSDTGAELIALSGGATIKTLRLMIARTSKGTNLATRLRAVSLKGFSGGPLSTVTNPVTFGHSAAANANSVAAYRYTSPVTQQSPFKPAFESFSSPGPVTISVDTAGNRMAVAESRKKPDIAAPDGVNTTFFFPGTGQDFEGDGFFNFFGTSAAAPHAAAVAALMIQKAGGPGKLSPKQVKSILQTSAPARPILLSGSTTPSKAWSPFDGFGLIDAQNALAKITP